MSKTIVKQTEKLTHFTLVSLLKQNDHQLHLSQTLNFAHTVHTSCMFRRGYKMTLPPYTALSHSSL
jgi:hypothetical protein